MAAIINKNHAQRKKEKKKERKKVERKKNRALSENEA